MKICGALRVFRTNPAAVLRVRGDDAPNFLQGQFSKDLRGLSAGEARYGLWLTVKGKVLADSYLVKSEGDSFMIVSLHSPAALIRSRLEDFIIADDVTVADETESWAAAAVVGEGADVFRPSEDTGVQKLAYEGRDDRSDWLFPRGSEPMGLARLAKIDDLAFERLRIDAEMIEIPKDLGPGELPHEGGLESVAVSYDKGCYLGQEIMARLKTRGKVRRRIVHVIGRGPTPPAAAPVFSNRKPIGELRSAACVNPGFVGLALLPADVAVGQEFSLGSSGASLVVG